MKYFVNFPYTAETLKNEYRELCKKLHPDTGGNAEEFKNMMNEYEQTARNLSGTKQHAQSEAERQAEEARRREEEEERREAERYAAEEKKRREREAAEEAERIRKAQEVSRAAVRAWASILERIPAAVNGKKRAYDFEDKKAAAAYMAATKRNVQAVINHYFPGLKVKVSISGEIWKEHFEISWTDGPTEQEIENIPELDFFVGAYYESDPYADYGSYRERQTTAPWREAYGGTLGDCTSFGVHRTLSEEGQEQAGRTVSEYFADYDPAKMFRNNETFNATFSEWCKFAETFKVKNVIRCWENLCRKWYKTPEGNEAGTIYYNSFLCYLREYVKVDVKPVEKAPEFAPKYGAMYKAIKKALSGNDFCTLQYDERKGENKYKPVDIFAALLDGLQGVYICKAYTYSDEKHWSRLYSTSYTIARNRREKFADLGIEIDSSDQIKSITPELRAALEKEREEIEAQRKAWEESQKAAQNGAKAEKVGNSKAETKKADSEPETTTSEAPADGLTLEEIAGGVAVVADDWKTTYRNRHQIKAHGCHWNKEAKRWEATDPADVVKVRAWFALRGGFGVESDPIKTDEEIKAEAAAEIAHDEQQARAFAEAFAAAADAMHEAVTSEPQSEPTEAPQSEPEAVAEEIPTANDEGATEPKQKAQSKPEAETAQDGRNCWAFVLLVSGKVARVMAWDYWATRSDAERTAEGMQIAAQGFRESAHVAVYQRRTDGRYYFAFGKNLGGRDIFPPVAEIEGGAFVALYDPEPTPTDEAPTEATEAPTEGATVADSDSSTTANDESATEGATAATADTSHTPPRERIRFSPDDYQEAA